MHRSESAVLFVSRENAGRGLLAEACLSQLGKSRFRVYSCGVPAQSNGQPKEWALLALKMAGIPIDGLHCKGWTKFIRNGAPRMDFVIALDEDTAYQHPIWPGQPQTAVWAYAPLVQQKGNGIDVGLATVQTLHSLRRRLELLVSLHARGVKGADLRHDLRDMAHL